jgi:lantibiotic modifying enzyme
MDSDRTTFLEAAAALGARLCRDALWAGPRCNWLGDAMEFVGNSWVVAHRACGPAVYDGTGGIALFLARLYRTTHEPIHRQTAEGGARQACSRLGDVPPQARAAFYSGLTGIAYALLDLGEAFNDPDWVDQGLRILESLAGDDPPGEGLDVVGGSAGAIPALLDVRRRYPRDFLLELAVRHGEHLLAAARKGENGWSWDTLKIPTQRDLTGFSHGAAGIAWALLELWKATGELRFRDAAAHGFAFERLWYNPAEENWPDFRNLGDPSAGPAPAPVYAVAWCHGAPGIGLSRLRAFELTGDPTYRDEAEAAVRTTARMLAQSAVAGSGNYSLCHGFAGNAELLSYASRVLGHPGYQEAAEQVGRYGTEHYLRTQAPWPCGVIGGGESPNLMLGVAGIADFYLRLARPSTYPPLVIIRPEADSPGAV